MSPVCAARHGCSVKTKDKPCQLVCQLVELPTICRDQGAPLAFDELVVALESGTIDLPAIVSRSDLIATVPLAAGAQFAELGTIELVRLPFKPPNFAVQQHWHRLYHHERATHDWARKVANLFKDTTDEWIEIESRLYRKESRHPSAGKRVRSN